jgi:hypothetical protein
LCRIYFRRFRITVWLIVLLLLGALVYLNQIGLPGFVKKPLLENLHARGLDLQFSRLRWRWYRGLVAENARFERADAPFTPRLTLQEVQVRLNHRALSRLRLQVDGLVLRHGKLVWPIRETNQPPRQLAIENIQTDLRFLPDDEWALDNFNATFAGARLTLSGTVTNASAVRQWRFFQAKHPAPAELWQNRLRQLADTLESIRFSAPPALALDIRGDARDPLSFTVRMRASAPRADTPWGTLAHGYATLGLYPSPTNKLSRGALSLSAEEAETRWARTKKVLLTAHLSSVGGQVNLANGDVTLSAAEVQTRWADATNLLLTVHASSVANVTNLVSANLALGIEQAGTQWGSASNIVFNAQWLHALTNPVPLSGQGQLICERVDARQAVARQVRLKAHLETAPAGAPRQADASWADWGLIEPYILDWEAQVADVRTSELAAQEVTGGGSWLAPKLLITNFVAKLDQGQLSAEADVDVATRALNLRFASNLDPHGLAPIVIPAAERWLAPFTWEQPPELNGEVALVLPPWTNRPPNWRDDLESSLRLHGEVNLEHGLTYRNVKFSSIRSHVMYSNALWHLPDLTILVGTPRRGVQVAGEVGRLGEASLPSEGRLEVALEADHRTQAFSAHLRSTLDPRVLRPALTLPKTNVLDMVTFTEPPWIEAEAHGHWNDLNAIGVQGHVSLTNFTFRDQAISGVQTAVGYTNRVLQFTAPHVQRGARQATADAIVADFNRQLVFLTNAFSTVEPLVIAHVIGEHIVRAIEPYRFDQPPVGHVHGVVPMHGEDEADLHFDLSGGPFNWWRFHVPEISGHVHWLGQHLELSQIRMGFYGGQAEGGAVFDFHPGKPTDYRLVLTTTNTELHALMADLLTSTNRLRGALSGNLVVTHADTTSLQTWNGFGSLQLHDGLIWDVPIFGTFSDVLNGMYPGLGSSRPSAGSCTFGITNGVIQSHDLEIRSTMVRLEYRGSVDFEGRVKAKVQAGLLRDVSVVGPVVSAVFWPVSKLFEYKVSGTLGEPKLEPVFLIPKVMLLPFQMPFHPFKTLRGLLPEDIGGSRTNNPALNPPKGQ